MVPWIETEDPLPPTSQSLGPDTGQTLGETERVLGLADWIDPETGTLAEDTPVRLEDH